MAAPKTATAPRRRPNAVPGRPSVDAVKKTAAHNARTAPCCFIRTATPNRQPEAAMTGHRWRCRASHIAANPAVAKNAAKCVGVSGQPSIEGLAASTA